MLVLEGDYEVIESKQEKCVGIIHILVPTLNMHNIKYEIMLLEVTGEFKCKW